MKGPCDIIIDSDTVTKRHRNKDLFNNEVEFWQKARDLSIAPEFEMTLARPDEGWEGDIVVERFRRVGIKGLNLLSKSQTKRLGQKVVDKILLLHNNSIAHRDLHVENLVFTKEWEPFFIDWEFATLTDSGVAYDIYGPEKSGVPKPDAHKHQAGVYWERNTPRALNRIFGKFDDFI